MTSAAPKLPAEASPAPPADTRPRWRETIEGADPLEVRAFGVVPVARWEPASPVEVAAVVADVQRAREACARLAPPPVAEPGCRAFLDASAAALSAAEAGDVVELRRVLRPVWKALAAPKVDRG